MSPGKDVQTLKSTQNVGITVTADRKSGSLLQILFKAVVEPFPAFSDVGKFLNSGRKEDAVVVGWGAAQDPLLQGRCSQSMKAVHSEHLIVTGSSDIEVPQEFSKN